MRRCKIKNISYMVATICPVGEGVELLGPYEDESLIKRERWGEKVNNDATK